MSSAGPLDRMARKGVQVVVEQLGLDTGLDLLLRTGPYGTHAALTDRRASPVQKIMSVVRPKDGLSLKKLREHPHGIDLGPLRRQLRQRLESRSRKIPLAAPLYLSDIPRAQARLQAWQPGEMRVIGRRHVRSNNSWMHNSHRLVKGPNRCTAMLHPEDAARRAISDGMRVQVSSRVGAIELPAEVTEAVMPGVVCVPHGFGHARDGVQLRVARREAAGASLNDITDELQVDALTGTAVLNGLPVQVQAVAAPD